MPQAHASEGRLFHDALAAAADELSIAHHTHLERELAAHAERALACSRSAIDAALTVWGKQVGPPWRAFEKAASLAAWTTLAAPRD